MMYAGPLKRSALIKQLGWKVLATLCKKILKNADTFACFYVRLSQKY